MIRFIAERNDLDYVIQPLSIDHLQAEFTGEGQVTLCWQPRVDQLEASAQAEKYIVYTRIEDNGFDNGSLVDNPEYIAKDLSPNVIYGFRITAVNDGGEGFPSEVISVCWPDSGDTALIINGFDRISGPAEVDFGDFEGFAGFIDMGVPDGSDIGYTGPQFNFNAQSPWKDDDAPGFGASYGNLETKVIPGNTFDFSYIHGKALRNAGYGFVTVSDEVIMNGDGDITKYPFVDLILGAAKETPAPKPFYPNEFITFSPELRSEIERFCNLGGNLFISGAYVGTDLFEKTPVDSPAIKFAQNTLKYFWRTNHAARSGEIFATDSLFQSMLPNSEFNTQYHPDIYMVEAPDAIEPYDSQGETLYRYFENNISAAVGYRGDYGVVVLGFPFETILKEKDRNRMMNGILEYLEGGRPKAKGDLK
jgi:hypothetical protein